MMDVADVLKRVTTRVRHTICDGGGGSHGESEVQERKMGKAGCSVLRGAAFNVTYPDTQVRGDNGLSALQKDGGGGRRRDEDPEGDDDWVLGWRQMEIWTGKGCDGYVGRLCCMLCVCA